MQACLSLSHETGTKLNQVNLNQLYSSLDFQCRHSSHQCFQFPPHSTSTLSYALFMRNTASEASREHGCSLKLHLDLRLSWIFERDGMSTSAWILCSTLNSPQNTASRGASSGEQKGIWEQIKNMNSNIPVAASACAQDYRVLRRLLAGEERLQVRKTFHSHLRYGALTHTDIHEFHFHIHLGLISLLEFMCTHLSCHIPSMI